MFKPIKIIPHERYHNLWYVVYSDHEKGDFYNKTRALDILRNYEYYRTMGHEKERPQNKCSVLRRSEATGKFISTGSYPSSQREKNEW